MSVFRKNMVTNDWVIFAPNRAARPKELKGQEDDNVALLASRPEYREACPFCRGNEHLTDREVLRRPEDGPWQTRVVENKYSSVDRNAQPLHRIDGLRKEMDGFGIHDVIIDHPLHNKTIALMDEFEIRALLGIYLDRYRQLQQMENVRHVVIFKNQGIKAGGSLEHPHSQIFGLPVIPFETRIRLHEMERYYDFHDHCLFCDTMNAELEAKVRIIYENEAFLAVMPYASLSPYHFWMAPRRHAPSFSLIGDSEIEALAHGMKIVFGKMFKVLGNPDFNFVIQSLAHFEREKNYFHWYLSVIPQIKHKGGLEYAGGLYVNPVMPETAAEVFRNGED